MTDITNIAEISNQGGLTPISSTTSSGLNLQLFKLGPQQSLLLLLLKELLTVLLFLLMIKTQLTNQLAKTFTFYKMTKIQKEAILL